MDKDVAITTEAFEQWRTTYPLAHHAPREVLRAAFLAGAAVGHRLATQAAIEEITAIRANIAKMDEIIEAHCGPSA